MQELTKPILYLAPMRGITGHIYRKAHWRFFGGYDIAVAPFIPMVKGKVVKKNHLADIFPENNRSIPLVPQTIGRSAPEFVVFCQSVADLGYTSVNWNLGCPYPMVVNKRRGSGLLPFPELITRFLEESLPHLSIKLSIKVRLGLESADELMALMPIFNTYPLSEIIIHPRTGKQMYTGVPNHTAFAQCASICKHPVVYNGDIVSSASFATVQSLFPSVTKFMIGRGAISFPHIFRQLQGKDIQDSKERFMQFHNELIEGYLTVTSPASTLGCMKELWMYWKELFPDRKAAELRMVRTKTLDKYKAAFEDIMKDFTLPNETIEARRLALAEDVKAAREEFKQDTCKQTSVESIMDELTQ